jgi:1-acyl-sn-glycerol-3-phosphate acyltransferase
MPVKRDEISFGTLVLYDQGEEFELAYDFVVRVGGDTVLIAPAGTRTDGASIPRFFWRFIGPPMTGKYRQAAVIHDAAYTGVLKWRRGGATIAYDRKSADALFLQLMEALGVPWWRRTLMHKAVRWFGAKRWTDR